MNLAEYRMDFKMVTIGYTNVGKTCIINRAVNDTYDSACQPTIGSANVDKTVIVDCMEVKLKIWDTAGQEKYRSLAPIYFNGAHGALLVYSVDSEDSFRDLDFWYNSFIQNCSTSSYYLALVANKIDLADRVMVDSTSGKEFAKKIGADFFEVSALTGQGIEEMFQVVASELMKLQEHECDVANVDFPSDRIVIDIEKTNEEKKGCC
ncbi:Ras-related protein Rab-1B [Tritrichomonas foetus]|uniref:Ras-related protein Rab-1B n=1 Tax=Tritrichomonas foetus TaxID=1144522 RepID=A0A1J4J0I7_9EUKA|nr:Ras-related protein Rab-1B [Tritrichomonas foetus]|eukprot:OHS93088.1 Ras-related protein Rab-1B [Tritrichomonas foetus]